MIDIKYCRKCKRAYDFSECPYCMQKELVWGSKEWNDKWKEEELKKEEKSDGKKS